MKIVALVQELLSDDRQFIDVVIVRTADQDLVSLVRRTFSEVLWRSDWLCVLSRKHPAKEAPLADEVKRIE